MSRWSIAVPLVAAVLTVAPLRASAQDVAPRDLRTGTFGNWSLSATSDRGLQINNRLAPSAVRLRFTHDSNGWFWIETLRGRAVLWTAGHFSGQSFEFDDRKPDPGAPPLAPGVYTFGTWTVRVTGDELSIEHPENPHRIVLTRTADGWIVVQGLRSRGDVTVRPGDDVLEGAGPGAP
jgi:hypothetical protein